MSPFTEINEEQLNQSVSEVESDPRKQALELSEVKSPKDLDQVLAKAGVKLKAVTRSQVTEASLLIAAIARTLPHVKSSEEARKVTVGMDEYGRVLVKVRCDVPNPVRGKASTGGIGLVKGAYVLMPKSLIQDAWNYGWILPIHYMPVAVADQSEPVAEAEGEASKGEAQSKAQDAAKTN